MWNNIVKHETSALKINLQELDRKNLCDLAFVTIDGKDAKDFDDAVFCIKHNDGYDLYVAIADVSLYVKPGSEIDKEALNRGTSIYFPNFVIPMLPEILSNNLCSLKPNEDRPSLVVKITLDNKCRIKKYRFFSAIIHSHARLIYEEVENDSFQQPLSDAVTDSLSNLKSLAKKRIAIKDQRGAIRIHSKEHLIKLNDDGISEAISFRKTIFANQMIEECMLLANECAADLLNNKFGYAPFRVHEEPDQLKLETLKKIVGDQSQTQKSQDPASQINSISKKISAKDQLKQSLVLQTMKRAEYSTDNVGHFGLQLDQYCHFTSPIRRYPDLLTHRMIKQCIENDDSYLSNIKNDQEICELSSKLEHRAENASRKVNQILIFDYLKRHVGESFEGVISGVTEFGLFITLEKFLVSGLLHVADLKRDRYQLSKDQTYLYGIKSGRRYRFGDSINIKIVAVSPFEGKMTLLQNEHKRRRKT